MSSEFNSVTKRLKFVTVLDPLGGSDARVNYKLGKAGTDLFSTGIRDEPGYQGCTRRAASSLKRLHYDLT